MRFKSFKKTLAKRLAESTGILFSTLLVFSAIVYAFTTWSPGGPPQAVPGEGNVAMGWGDDGTNIYRESGNVGIGTTVPEAKLEVNGNIIASAPTADNHLATKAYVDAAAGAYIITTRAKAQGGTCSSYPSAFCPAGWTAEESWNYCLYAARLSQTYFSAYTHTLCSK